MKKIFLILVSINLFFYGHSQITITNNDMPSAGDVFFTAQASQFGLDYATTGQNFNWDFSMLDTVSTKTDTMRTVLSTNTVYVVMFNNPLDQEHLASFAFQMDNSNLSNNFIQIDDVYYFFKNSSSQYEIVGYGAVVNGVPTAAKYNAPERYFDFPLNYGMTDSSISVWSMDVPNFGYYGQTIHHHYEVDGWGTVTTPAGTFDALRVKNIINTHDTVYIDSLSIGFGFDRPEQTEYVWMASGEGVPVLKASGSNGNITTVSYKIYSLPALASNVNRKTTINGYYIPESHQIIIENPNGNNLDIQLISIDGRVVYTTKSNSNLIQIPTESIAKGVSILQITGSKNNYLTRKIAVY